MFGQQVQKYTTANLNLRAAASTSSYVITVVPKGTIVTMQECNCDWLPVSYNGVNGYISTKYLSKVKQTNSSYSDNNRSYNNTSRSIRKATKQSNNSYKTYTNSFGERVQSPTRYNSQPSGATALCRDGTYSFSRNRRGTCSGHGGVARWL